MRRLAALKRLPEAEWGRLLREPTASAGPDRELLELAEWLSVDPHEAADLEAAASYEPWEPDHLVAGRYRVRRRLGGGRSNALYEARDEQGGPRAAIKVTRTGSERGTERLRREFVLSRKVDHPGVRRARDLLVDDRNVVLVLDYLEGGDLGSLLAGGQALPVSTALRVARQLASTLTAIHRAGIAHGDLKPENVMVDRLGRARIIDFGMSHGAGEEPGWDRGGTPRYLAPEQLRGSGSTPASDVYALALLLRDLLIGRAACEGDDLLGSPGIDESVQEEIDDPRLAKAIERGLARDPERRPGATLLLRLLTRPAKATSDVTRPEAGGVSRAS